MDNLKSPAYPFLEANESGYGNSVSVWQADGGKQMFPFQAGFTKLEYASLLIAQGLATRELLEILEGSNYPSGVAKLSISIAKAVLEEANK
jgi:hypothetical protein